MEFWEERLYDANKASQERFKLGPHDLKLYVRGFDDDRVVRAKCSCGKWELGNCQCRMLTKEQIKAEHEYHKNKEE
jgi:hypothetical protein